MSEIFTDNGRMEVRRWILISLKKLLASGGMEHYLDLCSAYANASPKI